jgi:hypothetical protein
MLGMDKKKVAMLIVGKKPIDEESGDFVDKGDEGYSEKEDVKAPSEDEENASHGHEAAMEDLMSCFQDNDSEGALKAWSNLLDMGKLPRKDKE